MPRILGIDSSLTGTGLARADIPDIMVGVPPTGPVPHTVALATARPSKSKPGDTWIPKARRVHEALTIIEGAILDGVKPDLIALEELAYGAKGTAVVVLHWLWGEVIHLCGTHQVPLLLVNVSAIKTFATGKGNAPKDEVMLAMAKRYPGANIADNNQADALAACMIGARYLGVPFDDMPQAHLRAMNKVVMQ